MSQKRKSLHWWFVPGKEKCPPSGLLSELSVCVCVCDSSAVFCQRDQSDGGGSARWR